MNDLDKRIAELKGWEFDPKMNAWWKSPGDKAVNRYELIGPRWSVEDAKALELVDELAPDGFELSQGDGRVNCRIFKLRYPSAKGEGSTRPEAICRAYIAAREWMATKAAK